MRDVSSAKNTAAGTSTVVYLESKASPQNNPNRSHRSAPLFQSAEPSKPLRSSRSASSAAHPSAQMEKNVAGASGVMMIPVPRSGIFESVSGIEEAEAITGIDEIRITTRLRDYVAAWPEGASYLGFIFARAESPGEVEEMLRTAHSKLEFKFSPRLAVEHPVTGKFGNQASR